MWGVGVDWRPPGRDALLYARLDRATKPGGYRVGAVGTYRPEKIWAYAIGAKSRLLDRRLQLNLEGFFYAYEDMQLVFSEGTGVRTENTDARIYGIDLELLASPLPGLRLSSAFSYLHTQTRDYFSLDPAVVTNPLDSRRLAQRDLAESNAENDRGGPRFAELNCAFAGDPELPCGLLGDRDGLDDFSGNRLPSSPRFKLMLAAEYEIPLSRWGSLTPRVQYSWQDDTYFRAFNRSFDRQDAFHQTYLKLIWISPERTWEVEAFVNNIEDEAVKGNIFIGPRAWGAPPLAWYRPPRYYGLRLGYRF
jgi:iron complex outermembrane receptor protein